MTDTGIPTSTPQTPLSSEAMHVDPTTILGSASIRADIGAEIPARGIQIPHHQFRYLWRRTAETPLNEPNEQSLERYCSEVYPNDKASRAELFNYLLEGRDTWHGMFHRTSPLKPYESLLVSGRIHRDPLDLTPTIKRDTCTFNQFRDNPGSLTVIASTTASAPPYPTLLGAIIGTGASSGWSDQWKFMGHASFLKGYFEWAKYALGCEFSLLKSACIYEAVFCSLFPYPSSPEYLRAFLENFNTATNTAYTPLGEFGMTLLHIRDCFGLPITGDIYDEYIPEEQYLFGRDSEFHRLTPSVCIDLFAVYHHLACPGPGSAHKAHGKVTYSAWIAYFINFPGLDVLEEFPSITKPVQKDVEGEKNDFKIYPLGFRPNHFEKIRGSPKIYRELFFCGFIALWLSYFAVPSHPYGFIRPEVLRMAASIGIGIKHNIGMHVYAHIHRSIHQFLDADVPGTSKAVAPLHYIYTFLGCHLHKMYTTICPSEYMQLGYPHMLKFASAVPHGLSDQSKQDARLAFRLPLCHSIFDKHPIGLDFDEEIECTASGEFFRKILKKDRKKYMRYLELLISIRCRFIPFRRGNITSLEPYFPNRIGRLLGYDQQFPVDIPFPEEAPSLRFLGALWYEARDYFNNSKFMIFPKTRKTQASVTYLQKLDGHYGNYFSIKLDSLTQKKRSQLSLKQQTIDRSYWLARRTMKTKTQTGLGKVDPKNTSWERLSTIFDLADDANISAVIGNNDPSAGILEEALSDLMRKDLHTFVYRQRLADATVTDEDIRRRWHAKLHKNACMRDLAARQKVRLVMIKAGLDASRYNKKKINYQGDLQLVTDSVEDESLLDQFKVPPSVVPTSDDVVPSQTSMDAETTTNPLPSTRSRTRSSKLSGHVLATRTKISKARPQQSMRSKKVRRQPQRVIRWDAPPSYYLGILPEEETKGKGGSEGEGLSQSPPTIPVGTRKSPRTSFSPVRGRSVSTQRSPSVPTKRRKVQFQEESPSSAAHDDMPEPSSPIDVGKDLHSDLPTINIAATLTAIKSLVESGESFSSKFQLAKSPIIQNLIEAFGNLDNALQYIHDSPAADEASISASLSSVPAVSATSPIASKLPPAVSPKPRRSKPVTKRRAVNSQGDAEYELAIAESLRMAKKETASRARARGGITFKLMAPHTVEAEGKCKSIVDHPVTPRQLKKMIEEDIYIEKRKAEYRPSSGPQTTLQYVPDAAYHPLDRNQTETSLNDFVKARLDPSVNAQIDSVVAPSTPAICSPVSASRQAAVKASQRSMLQSLLTPGDFPPALTFMGMANGMAQTMAWAGINVENFIVNVKKICHALHWLQGFQLVLKNQSDYDQVHLDALHSRCDEIEDKIKELLNFCDLKDTVKVEINKRIESHEKRIKELEDELRDCKDSLAKAKAEIEEIDTERKISNSLELKQQVQLDISKKALALEMAKKKAHEAKIKEWEEEAKSVKDLINTILNDPF